MPRVAALFRHPVKGFTPEPRESLVVRPDGRVAGDRVLAFRFANAATPEQEDGLDYWPKAKGLALQDFPSLAALRLAFDDETRTVRIRRGPEILVEAGLDEEGRRRLVDAVTGYLRTTPDGARLDRPGRTPLVLVGDGASPRFQDRPRGFVSVHGRASAAALGRELGAAIDDRRFRSNVVIDGLDPWAELDWDGDVRIGEVALRAEGPIVRCLATHANPETGVRDAPVLTTLTRRIGQREPTLGRLLLPAGAGGVIRVGDEVLVERAAGEATGRGVGGPQ